jgi:hypothetical protein
MTFLPLAETLKKEEGKGAIKNLLTGLRAEKLLKDILSLLSPIKEGKVFLSSCKEGVLALTTDTPASSQELYLNTQKIVKAMNRSLGEEVFKKIKVRIRSHEKR